MEKFNRLRMLALGLPLKIESFSDENNNEFIELCHNYGYKTYRLPINEVASSDNSTVVAFYKQLINGDFTRDGRTVINYFKIANNKKTNNNYLQCEILDF